MKCFVDYYYSRVHRHPSAAELICFRTLLVAYTPLQLTKSLSIVSLQGPRVRHFQGPPLPGSATPWVHHSQGEPLFSVSEHLINPTSVINPASTHRRRPGAEFGGTKKIFRGPISEKISIFRVQISDDLF